MAELISLLPIRPDALAVGAPLAQAVYDWHGNVLAPAGSTIQSQEQLDGLLKNGFVADSSWDLAVASAVAAPPTAAPPVAAPPTTAPPAARPSDAQETIVRMEEVHWTVGEAMTMQPHNNLSLRYAVQLFGFVKNRMLFVSAPVVDGRFEMIREGQSFVVRAFSGKKAYAFMTAALKSVHSPHPYLLLSYPREVRCTLVRQSARVSVKLIASVSLDQPPRTAAATITDLSTGGGLVVSKEALGVKGETGNIKFKVYAADADAYLNLRFILRSASPDEQGGGFRHGIEFVDVPAHERLILSAFVHQGLAS